MAHTKHRDAHAAKRGLAEWQVEWAQMIGDAFPLTPTTPIQATGNHLVAAQDEPEPEVIDRGPLTVPAELTGDAAFAAFDLARNVDKGERLARVNDAHAMDLQVQFQGCIGGLPE